MTTPARSTRITGAGKALHCRSPAALLPARSPRECRLGVERRRCLACCGCCVKWEGKLSKIYATAITSGRFLGLPTGRYYVDPVCRATDDTDPSDQEKVDGATSGHVVTGRFKLPSGLTCSRCIVQMVYCESTQQCDLLLRR